MWKNVLLILAVFALVASAGTVPVGHYRITLSQPAAVQGTVLKPGDYSLILKDTKLTFIGENGKAPPGSDREVANQRKEVRRHLGSPADRLR